MALLGFFFRHLPDDHLASPMHSHGDVNNNEKGGVMKKSTLTILAVASFVVAFGCSGQYYDSDTDELVDENFVGEESGMGTEFAEADEIEGQSDTSGLMVGGYTSGYTSEQCNTVPDLPRCLSTCTSHGKYCCCFKLIKTSSFTLY